jgi:hypothetical protein
MAYKHVFVVGFPDENLANLNCFLQMTGCRVSAAKNAMEAVNLMLSKKFAFRSLDLILMGNCVLFLQFMDMFDGVIKLSKKYSFLVVDEFGLQERFKDMLDENKSQHEIEFCSNRDLIDKFQSILRNGTWA